MEAIVFIILKIFFHKAAFWETFSQINSVGAQNISSLFKIFSSINFNNLLRIKANVQTLIAKFENISLGDII